MLGREMKLERERRRESRRRLRPGCERPRTCSAGANQDILHVPVEGLRRPLAQEGDDARGRRGVQTVIGDPASTPESIRFRASEAPSGSQAALSLGKTRNVAYATTACGGPDRQTQSTPRQRSALDHIRRVSPTLRIPRRKRSDEPVHPTSPADSLDRGRVFL
jgi:hypothetical protein